MSGKVRGETVNPCIEGVMSVFQDRMRAILDDHGIEQPDPQPEEWYPYDKFVTILEVVGEDVGENAQNKIGEATPKFFDWPPSATDPESAFEALVTIFDENHKAVSGKYSFETPDEDVARVTSSTEYPEEWEKGLLKGTAEENGASYARVEIADDKLTKTVYEVSW